MDQFFDTSDLAFQDEITGCFYIVGRAPARGQEDGLFSDDLGITINTTMGKVNGKTEAHAFKSSFVTPHLLIIAAEGS